MFEIVNIGVSGFPNTMFIKSLFDCTIHVDKRNLEAKQRQQMNCFPK
jgi:hypothetical protein